MRTALAIVTLDDNDGCPEQVPIKIFEVATPEEIEANLNRLLEGYPVRDAAYTAILKLSFLADKLYHDTANPSNPATGYTNIALFLALTNWDKITSSISDTIHRRQQEKLSEAPNMMAKAGVMYENTKESAGVKLMFSALDFLKEFLQGKISQSFSAEDFENVLNTLKANLPLYTSEITGVLKNLHSVFLNPEAGFQDIEKINRFFQTVQEGVAFLEKSDFTPKN